MAMNKFERRYQPQTRSSRGSNFCWPGGQNVLDQFTGLWFGFLQKAIEKICSWRSQGHTLCTGCTRKYHQKLYNRLTPIDVVSERMRGPRLMCNGIETLEPRIKVMRGRWTIALYSLIQLPHVSRYHGRSTLPQNLPPFTNRVRRI